MRSCQSIAGGALLALVAGNARAQTQIDLRAQAKNVDFSAASFTKPFQAGIVLPATCSLGQTFFKTNAQAGANFFACASINTWTVQGGGNVMLTSPNFSLTIGGSSSNPTLDVSTSYLNTLYPQLTAGNVFGAGFKQVFTPNATTAGARNVCATLPSAPVGGDYGCTPAGIWWHSDGAVIQYHVTHANLSSISGYVPQWSGTSGTQLSAGLPVSATAAPSTVVESDGGGHIAAAWLPAANTRQVCSMIVGSDNGPVLTNTDLGPQRRRCYVPFAATVVEVMVAGDGGTPSLIAGRNHAGTAASLTTPSLATTGGGGLACSNTGGTTGLDGATACSGTLQNTALAPGDWIELVSGTAGGVAKRVSVAVTYTIN